jgi:hypothetical protein
MSHPLLRFADTPADAGLVDAFAAIARAVPVLLPRVLLGIIATTLLAAAGHLVGIDGWMPLLTLPIAASGALAVTWAAVRSAPADPLRAFALRGLPRLLIAAAPAGAAIVAAGVCALTAGSVEPIVAVIIAAGAIGAALTAVELLLLPVVVAGGLPITDARSEAARLRRIGGRGDAVTWTATALLAGIVIGAGIDEAAARLMTAVPQLAALEVPLREVARWTMFLVAAAGPVLYIARADARLRRGV